MQRSRWLIYCNGHRKVGIDESGSFDSLALAFFIVLSVSGRSCLYACTKRFMSAGRDIPIRDQGIEIRQSREAASHHGRMCSALNRAVRFAGIPDSAGMALSDILRGLAIGVISCTMIFMASVNS